MQDHPNVETLRQGFEVKRRAPFNDEDKKLLDELFTDDITWHGTGEGPWGRTFAAHGKEEVFALFGAMAAGSGGSLDVRPDRIYADDDHAAVVLHETASRPDGASIALDEVHILRLRDGKVVDLWDLPEDIPAHDNFFDGK